MQKRWAPSPALKSKRTSSVLNITLGLESPVSAPIRVSEWTIAVLVYLICRRSPEARPEVQIYTNIPPYKYYSTRYLRSAKQNADKHYLLQKRETE